MPIYYDFAWFWSVSSELGGSSLGSFMLQAEFSCGCRHLKAGLDCISNGTGLPVKVGWWLWVKSPNVLGFSENGTLVPKGSTPRRSAQLWALQDTESGSCQAYWWLIPEPAQHHFFHTICQRGRSPPVFKGVWK